MGRLAPPNPWLLLSCDAGNSVTNCFNFAAFNVPIVTTQHISKPVEFFPSQLCGMELKSFVSGHFKRVWWEFSIFAWHFFSRVHHPFQLTLAYLGLAPELNPCWRFCLTEERVLGVRENCSLEREERGGVWSVVRL